MAEIIQFMEPLATLFIVILVLICMVWLVTPNKKAINMLNELKEYYGSNNIEIETEICLDRFENRTIKVLKNNKLYKANIKVDYKNYKIIEYGGLREY